MILEVVPDTNKGYVIMRKSFFSLMVAFIAMLSFVVSCTEAKYNIVVEQINKSCPISLGVAGELTDVAFEDGNLVYNFTMNESLTDIEVLSSNPQLMKNSMSAMFRTPTKELKDMMDLMEQDKVGLTFNYVGRDSGKKASLTISYDDLKEALETESTPDELLKAQVDVTNATCPLEIGGGLVMTKLEIEGNYVVYYISVDDDLVSIRLLNQLKEESKNGIVAGLKQQINDPSFKAFIFACKNANKGIAYKYIGNTSKEECLILIELSELGV